MAKVKLKTLLGVKSVSVLEVDSNADNDFKHSFKTQDGTIHHNCNGPHAPLVVVDEIDTVSGEGKKAFKEISGMLDSRGDKKALRVGISTRKSTFGLMNKQIENAEKERRTVRRWTVFEFTERCTDERSGTEKVMLYYNQERMETLTEEQYLKKDPNKQKEYIAQEGFSGCANCPIFPICLTDAKKQTSTSNMLKTLDEVIQKAVAEGPDWSLAQLVNLKPSIEGIIFREFEERLHVKTWNQMWLMLTGQEFPGECTHDIFVAKCHSMGLQAFAGIDWGFSSPNTIVIFFIDKKDNVYVVKTDGMTHVSAPTWIHYIKTKYHNKYRIQLYVPDQADQGSIMEMQKAGLPVSNSAKKEPIKFGIQIIRKLLKSPISSEPKLVFAKETCSHIIAEMSQYHYKLDASGLATDEPDTEHDHWIDALRYAITLILGKSTIILGDALTYDSTYGLRDSSGVAFTKAPTPVEFAEAMGIPINNNDVPSVADGTPNNLGKIGKISDIDRDEDPGSDPNNSGGFIWSF